MLFPTEFIFVVSIVAIVMVIGLTFSGYKEGFVMKLLEFCSTLVCIILAWSFSEKVAEKISIMPREYVAISGTSVDDMFYQAVNETLVFIVLFFVFRILILFVRPLFKKINWIPIVGFLNKILGSVMGFLQAFLVLAIFCIILSSPLFINGKQILEESKLTYVNDVTKSILSSVSNRYSVMESIQKLQSSSEKMGEEDLNNIRNWLDQYDFDDSEQDEIIEILKMRSE